MTEATYRYLKRRAEELRDEADQKLRMAAKIERILNNERQPADTELATPSNSAA
jgi:hypothetical protein